MCVCVRVCECVSMSVCVGVYVRVIADLFLDDVSSLLFITAINAIQKPPATFKSMIESSCRLGGSRR